MTNSVVPFGVLVEVTTCIGSLQCTLYRVPEQTFHKDEEIFIPVHPQLGLQVQGKMAC